MVQLEVGLTDLERRDILSCHETLPNKQSYLIMRYLMIVAHHFVQPATNPLNRSAPPTIGPGSPISTARSMRCAPATEDADRIPGSLTLRTVVPSAGAKVSLKRDA